MPSAARFLPILALLAATLHAQEHAQGLAGQWQGTYEEGKGHRMIFKITGDSAHLKATMYDADESGNVFPVTKLTLSGAAVSFTVPPLDLSFAGTLSPDGNSITAVGTRPGGAHPFNLTRPSADTAWAIPAPPKTMPPDASPGFEVVSVKPSDPARPGKLFTIRGRHVMTINTTVSDIISFAYGLNPKQVVNAPAWFATDKFDLDGIPDVDGQPSKAQFQLLFQKALADRFQLKFHNEKRELAVYALSVAKAGPKLTTTVSQPADPRNFMFRALGNLTVSNSTMQDFCDGMQGAVMDRPVVDHTGLTDRYDFQLKWTPDESQFAAMGARIPPPTEDPNAPPSLYTALQEQLGLKLESTKAPAPAMVIDKLEKPSAN